MRKTAKKRNFKALATHIGFAVVMVFLVGAVVRATVEMPSQTFSGDIGSIVINNPSGEEFSSAVFGGSTSDDWNVGGALSVTGTSTLQEVVLGSRFSEALTFTASGTPGGLFSLENTGETKLCNLVEVDISTADTAGGGAGDGGRISFAAATSTTASTFSGSGANLIATTTFASSTSGFADSREHVGSYNAATFLWTTGEFVNGIFDITNQEGTGVVTNATSSAYDGNAGKVYLTCHSR